MRCGEVKSRPTKNTLSTMQNISAFPRRYAKNTNELSEEGKEHLEAYERLMLEAQSIGDEETFIEAFRLGARMMLDVLEEPKVNVR